MKSNSKLSVSQAIDFLIEKFSTQVRIKNGREVIGSTNAKDYKMLKNSLEKFVSESYKKPFATFSFSQVDTVFLLSYVDYLEKRAADMGTKGAIPNRLKKLQAVFNHARDMGVDNVDTAVFRCVEEKTKIIETSPLIIPHKVIQQIETIDRDKFSSIEQFHLDLFLFSYYAGGMSCSDMAYLTTESVKCKVITYEKMRIHKVVEVPLIPKSEKILSVYQHKCDRHYLLPIFSNKHISEKQQRERIERLSLQTNKTLIKVCKEIKYKKKISLNSTQAAFIARLVETGIAPYCIAQYAGCTVNYVCKHFL